MLASETQPVADEPLRFGGDKLSAPQKFAVTPAQGRRFSGPVAVLISNVTVSAGENIAMMLKTFPNVTLIGERTASVHSDVLDKRLPIGWQVTISNEIFENSDGIVYEARGVPPAIEAPYFIGAPDGADRGPEAALRLLSRPAATPSAFR